jgi:hypothetical protein
MSDVAAIDVIQRDMDIRKTMMRERPRACALGLSSLLEISQNQQGSALLGFLLRLRSGRQIMRSGDPREKAKLRRDRFIMARVLAACVFQHAIECG